MLSQFILFASATIGALLPIVNPLSAVPVFMSITDGSSTQDRRRQARRAAIFTGGILLVTLFAGALILGFFGITLPILRIAGGLIILRSGFRMLEPDQRATLTSAEKKEAQQREDVAFTPLAMPMLAGPGSIAVTISLATDATSIVSYAGIAAGAIVVALAAWLTLLTAASTSRFISETGMNVVTRVMGLILICIGIRFLATGFFEGLTSESVSDLLREWIGRF